MYYNEHGGQCCGISHVSDFGDNDTDVHLNSHLDELKSDFNYVTWDGIIKNQLSNGNHIVEIVLTDDQLRSRNNFWLKELKKRRARRVTRFLNANSGNMVNIFHLKIGKAPRDKIDPDDPWKEKVNV